MFLLSSLCGLLLRARRAALAARADGSSCVEYRTLSPKRRNAAHSLSPFAQRSIGHGFFQEICLAVFSSCRIDA